ncbi:BppU family phage baseplate upper protein, partial [Enterococcus durans]|uniref:BppU family phage baseplate upper protein n=1 Tax=Enterococcus durans TaxID=53345 RepID=UPI0039A6B5E0
MVYKINESIIVIQAEATNPNNTGVVFWSHDRGTAKLRMQLVRKNEIPQSLPEGTTVPIRLMFRSATAEGGYGKHDYLATIEDRVNGIVSIVLEDNILGYVGTVEGSVYIDFPNDRSLDTAGRFTFSIKRSPIDDSTTELEDYYFNGFSQTIDKIEQIVSNAKTEIDTKVAGTKKEFDTEVEKIKTSIGDANQSLTTLNGDMTALSEKITEADQHFINKESVEVGPLIFKNTTITTQDWNNITESGVYYCAGSSGINAPYTGKLYGLLTVYSEQAVTIQKYEFQNSIYMRTFAGNPAAWGNWKKVALSSEVMNLTDPQTALGVKNFSDGIQIAGDRVVGENEHVVYTLDASNSKSFIDGYATFIKHGKIVIANGTVKFKKAYAYGVPLDDKVPDEFIARGVNGMIVGSSGSSNS